MIDGLAERFHEAVQAFWDARDRQQQKQAEAGKLDTGTRGAVTGGTQMGALEGLVADILVGAGLNPSHIRARTALSLPGYYRSEKKWDLLVLVDSRLLLAIEFKSQVGPSFGNNFNNRAEEALTLATREPPTRVTFPAAALNFRTFAAAIDAHARAFINSAC